MDKSDQKRSHTVSTLLFCVGGLFRRTDGTVLTQDCSVGLRLAQRKLVKLSLIGAIAVSTVIAVCAYVKVAYDADQVRRSATAGMVECVQHSSTDFVLVTKKNKTSTDVDTESRDSRQSIPGPYDFDLAHSISAEYASLKRETCEDCGNQW